MDKLAIINKSLMKCGLPLAAALADCDWNASVVYDSAVEECLRSFPWGFAQKFASLAQSSQPPHGYLHGYDLPPDCLRVIDIHCAQSLRSPRASYSVAGKKLYANVNPCYLRYVTRNVDPEDFPPDFADALAGRIAMEIAPLSAQTMQLVPSLIQLFQASQANAQAADARENAERVPLDINILASRGGVREKTGSEKPGKNYA